MKIYTHVSVDLDAASSVWAARKYIPGADKAAVVFVPANYNGADILPGDIAVDIYAGGRGLKGAQESNGHTHSCFLTILQQFAPREDMAALRNLAAFIDAGDSTGNAIKVLAPNTSPAEQGLLYAVSLGAVFDAEKNIHQGDDAAVVEWMSNILDSFLQMGREKVHAIELASKVVVIGGVATAHNKSGVVRHALYEEFGARMIVFVDERNNALGIHRKNGESVRTDHPLIRAVVKAAGETEWFAHTAGFLFSCGSRKAPMKTMSRIRPEDLANAARKALAEEDAKK